MRAAVRALISDRAARPIVGIGGGIVVCLIGLGAYLCVDLRRMAWEHAERDADNMLALVGQGIGRDIRLYDHSLREAARLAARPEVLALDPEIRRLAVFDAITREGGLGSIAVTDAAGRTLYTSDPIQSGPPDLGDLPDFAIHRGSADAGLILSGPIAGRSSGRSVLRLTRRIDGPDGAFAGIVSGAVFLDYIQSLFEPLRIETGSTVNVFLRNGTLLARAPFDARYLGSSIAQGAAYRHYRVHGRGHFIGRAALDDRERFYAFADLGDPPLIVTVAVGTDSILRAWIFKAGIVGALVLCLSGLTVGLTLLLLRDVDRRAREAASSRADNAALALLARTDGLTGLPNRRRYDEVLAAAWQQAARSGARLSLLVVDADHFKQFNDRFGHHRGDEVLKVVAGCLRQILDPPGGVSCRLGGEEFAAILPGHDGPAALALAERVRRAVVALQIGHAPEVGGIVTVSIGVATGSPREGVAPDTLFAEADGALYAAKGAGRNRVRAAPGVQAPGLALSA